MSRQDLRRKIEELQKAKESGKKGEEEKGRRATVIRELEAVEMQRREAIHTGTDASPEERRAAADVVEEYIQKRRQGGGGGR